MDTRVSVLIATRRRPQLLRETLRSLARASGSGRVEVVVADNADDGETARVCEEAGRHLALARVVEPAPGKNAALNRAVARSTGDLLLFTDDDVEVDAGWIEAMAAAAARWPRHAVYGGRVLPLWPHPPPAHLRETRYAGVCFTLLDPALPEGPTGNFRPFGPNMAVRREVFQSGHRFDPAVGPSGTSYIMGSETEFVRRVTRSGPPAVFVPRSTVHHRIRPGELTARSLLRRGVRYGRQLAHLARGVQEQEGEPEPSGRRVPPYQVKELLLHGGAALRELARGNRAGAFERGMDAAVLAGTLQQRYAQGGRPGASAGERSDPPDAAARG